MHPFRVPGTVLVLSTVAALMLSTTTAQASGPAAEVGAATVTKTAKTAKTAKTCKVSGVDLSWYPGAETGYPALAKHRVRSAPALLDALARDYANQPRVTAYG